MKLLYTISLLFIAITARAQFGQVGAVWTYNDHLDATNQNFPRAIQSVADTVILGQACHIIAGECACGSPYPNYVYETNRKVYFFNVALNAFTLLYDFNLEAGEEWTVIAKNVAGDSLRLHVDSTATDTINGVVCKVQYIHTVATYGLPYVFEGPVVERIGSRFCLYPQSATCDPPTMGLRCYEDDLLGSYDTHLAPACEEIFVDSGIGINENEQAGSVTLFPNPFREEAIFRFTGFPAGKLFLEISDAAGRIIRNRNITSRESRISKEGLPEGIYFYKVISPDAVVSGKLIII